LQKNSPGHLAWCYLMAVAASLLSLTIIAGLQHVVGFVPMLFLPAIVLVQSQWGVRPAVLSIILCTLGSVLLMTEHPQVQEKVHIWANLLLLPGIAASLIYLMETRRRHQVLEQERGSELSILLESMPEAVFIFDTQARVMELNRAAEALTDRTRPQLVGIHLRELARLLQASEADGELHYDHFVVSRALRGESVRDERRHLRQPATGATILAVLSANPMRDGEGRQLGALLVVRDITEITQLQARIADTDRHLAIGQMAAGIAHDFNNVLDTIAQAAAVMEMRQGAGAHDRNYIRMIQNAVHRGAEIINRVREYIRGGSGEQTPVDVRQIIEEALDLASPMWRQGSKYTIERDLQPVPLVRANTADLRRVFTNLIINSIQALPEGGRITVRCGAVNNHVMGSVTDNGPGIPPAIQPRIFLPYFTTKAHGTGLGLSGAQRIVQSLGGNISYATDAGKGTTFTVELPKIPVEKEESRRVA